MIKGRRKQRVGTVVGDRMDKSVVVAVSWTRRHPLYKKARSMITRFTAHDGENTATIGDVVRIEETRPLSRTKRWRLVEVIQAVDVADIQPDELGVEEVLGTADSGVNLTGTPDLENTHVGESAPSNDGDGFNDDSSDTGKPVPSADNIDHPETNETKEES